MEETVDYTIKLEGEGKSRNLIYKENDHVLIIFLDMSGIEEFDWVGNGAEIKEWNVPSGDLINNDKREEILNRIIKWDSTNNTKIQI